MVLSLLNGGNDDGNNKPHDAHSNSTRHVSGHTHKQHHQCAEEAKIELEIEKLKVHALEARYSMKQKLAMITALTTLATVAYKVFEWYKNKH